MCAKLVAASIDVTKIDKSRLISVDKDGNAFKNGAVYCEILISCNDDFDQYKNDVGITLQQSKEERTAKEKKTYIGNGRTIWDSEKPAGSAGPSDEDKKADQPDLSAEEAKDDLPF